MQAGRWLQKECSDIKRLRREREIYGAGELQGRKDGIISQALFELWCIKLATGAINRYFAVSELGN